MLYKFLHKNGLAIAFGLALIAGLTATLSLSIGSVKYEEAHMQAGENIDIIKIKDVEKKNQEQRRVAHEILNKNETERVGVLIGWGLFLTVLAGLVALVFPLVKSVENPKSLIKFGASFIGILLLIGVCYASSSTSVFKEGLPVEVSGAKVSGAIVGSLVVCVAIALFSMVAGEVYRIVKERN